jgi:hypothetical protein
MPEIDWRFEIKIQEANNANNLSLSLCSPCSIKGVNQLNRVVQPSMLVSCCYTKTYPHGIRLVPATTSATALTSYTTDTVIRSDAVEVVIPVGMAAPNTTHG